LFSLLFRLVRKIKGSNEARILAENFISLSALKVLGYIFPLITLPYLARVIGVDKFGEIAFAAAVIVYFQTIVDYGFNYTAVRDIARNRTDLKIVSGIFSTIMTIKVILLFISFIILLLCIFIFPSFYENRLILLLTFLYIPGGILFPDWFFQGMEKMKYITIMNLLSKAIFTGLVFVIIKEKSDYIYQPVLIAVGSFLSGIVSLPIIKREFHVRFSIPALSEIITAFKGSWNMFVTLFVPNLYTNFSIILIKYFGGLIPTGLYSGGFRFIDLIDQLFMVLSRTFYPFLARRLDKHRLYVIISGVLSIFAGLFLFFGADLLVKVFYTAEFAESAKVIKIMAVCPFFIFLMNTYGPNYLVLVGKEHILRNIVIFCSIGGFILSWIIIPRYSYAGVAITITIVWGIRGFLTALYAIKSEDYKLIYPVPK
jgi:O-antigen/teichoic acid export membrane protein